jgi:hypothetical protein
MGTLVEGKADSESTLLRLFVNGLLRVDGRFRCVGFVVVVIRHASWSMVDVSVCGWSLRARLPSLFGDYS